MMQMWCEACGTTNVEKAAVNTLKLLCGSDLAGSQAIGFSEPGKAQMVYPVLEFQEQANCFRLHSDYKYGPMAVQKSPQETKIRSRPDEKLIRPRITSTIRVYIVDNKVGPIIKPW